MKRGDFGVALLAMFVIGLIGLFTFPGRADAKAEYVMKVAIVAPPVQACGRFGAMLKENLEKATQGRIEVQDFPGGQLGSCIELANKASMNMIQVALPGCPAACSLGGNSMKLSLMTLPYIFRNYDDVEKFLQSDLVKELYDSTDHLNTTIVGFIDYGFACLATNKPVRKIEEIKGLKIRVPESYIQKSMTTAMGGSPTVIPFTETYEGLKRGIVDGIDQAWTTLWKAKLYEATPYVTDTAHWYGTFPVMINKTWLKSLPPELEAIVLRVIEETCIQERAASRAEEIEAKKVLAEKGVEIITLSPEETAKLVEMMKPVQAEFEDEIGKEYLQRVLSFMGHE